MRICCILVEHYGDMFIPVEDMKEVYYGFAIDEIDNTNYDYVQLLRNTTLKLICSVLEILDTCCMSCSTCGNDMNYYKTKYRQVYQDMLLTVH